MFYLAWLSAGFFGLVLDGFGWKGFAIWLIAPTIIGIVAQAVALIIGLAVLIIEWIRGRFVRGNA